MDVDAFNVITGVAIAVMIPIAGALLISAIMVLPAAIGMRIGKGFNTVIIISVFMGLIGMLTGLTSSYYLETPPSASITLIFIGLFLLVNIYRRVVVMVQRKQKCKETKEKTKVFSFISFLKEMANYFQLFEKSSNFSVKPL